MTALDSSRYGTASLERAVATDRIGDRQSRTESLEREELTGLIRITDRYRASDFINQIGILPASLKPESDFAKAIMRTGFEIHIEQDITLDKHSRSKLAEALASGAALALPPCFYSFGIVDSMGPVTMGTNSAIIFYNRNSSQSSEISDRTTLRVFDPISTQGFRDYIIEIHPDDLAIEKTQYAYNSNVADTEPRMGLTLLFQPLYPSQEPTSALRKEIKIYLHEDAQVQVLNRIHKESLSERLCQQLGLELEQNISASSQAHLALEGDNRLDYFHGFDQKTGLRFSIPYESEKPIYITTTDRNRDSQMIEPFSNNSVTASMISQSVTGLSFGITDENDKAMIVYSGINPYRPVKAFQLNIPVYEQIEAMSQIISSLYKQLNDLRNHSAERSLTNFIELAHTQARSDLVELASRVGAKLKDEQEQPFAKQVRDFMYQLTEICPLGLREIPLSKDRQRIYADLGAKRVEYQNPVNNTELSFYSVGKHLIYTLSLPPQAANISTEDIRKTLRDFTDPEAKLTIDNRSFSLEEICSQESELSLTKGFELQSRDLKEITQLLLALEKVQMLARA
jgi:regulator of replication initiation timing